MNRRLEAVAAIVNGLIVLLLPLLFILAASVFSFDSNTSVTVRPPGVWPILGVISAAFEMSAIMLPFAMLAGWRTWIHASRDDRQSSGWRGVLEAGACGVIVALAVLAPGIVTRPLEAPPYVIAYGGAALIVGVVVGLILRATALLVLKLERPANA
jgi:hypothetical protein